MKLPTRLLPYDLYERHEVVARLLRGPLAGRPDASILDVGGRAELLSRFLERPVISVNVDGTGNVMGSATDLPFADDAFSAVVSIDTVEHLPESWRLRALREGLRVASHYLIVAAPYGSEGHSEYERGLDRLYRAIHGKPHLYLAEHVRYGLPSPEAVEQWRRALNVRRVERYFAGDYLWQGKQFEHALFHHADRKASTRLRGILHQIEGLALFHPVRLSRFPSPRSNRFYLLFEKRPVTSS